MGHVAVARRVIGKVRDMLNSRTFKCLYGSGLGLHGSYITHDHMLLQLSTVSCVIHFTCILHTSVQVFKLKGALGV